jgi:predicted nucleic acid-binding protein
LQVLLAALPTYRPKRETWALMEGWALDAAARGRRFGVGDLSIAAIAAERTLRLWSLDADFVAMADLGWIELHRG